MKIITDKKTHWLIDGRYAIYKNDGVVYDTTQAKDIPRKVFKLRDELMYVLTTIKRIEKELNL